MDLVEVLAEVLAEEDLRLIVLLVNISITWSVIQQGA